MLKYSHKNSKIAVLEVWILQKKILSPTMVVALTRSYIKDGGSKIWLHKTLIYIYIYIYILYCFEIYCHSKNNWISLYNHSFFFWRHIWLYSQLLILLFLYFTINFLLLVNNNFKYNNDFKKHSWNCHTRSFIKNVTERKPIFSYVKLWNTCYL